LTHSHRYIKNNIALIGHIDTVPGELPVMWEGGVLRGRGAVDAKGPLASAFTGASFARRAVESSLKVYVIAAVGEEGPSHGAKHLIDKGWKFDHVIVLEPSNNDRVIVEYRGASLIKLLCESEGGHSSTPWITESACDKIWRFWGEISRKYTTPKSRIVMALVKARCGESHNVLPRSGEAIINSRLAPGIDDLTLRSVVQEALPKGCTYELLTYTPPVRVSLNNPAPRAIVRAILKNGGRALPARKWGTSDMNILYGTVTSDIAAYGPGKSELSHTNAEEIEERELEFGARVYGEALIELSRLSSRESLEFTEG
jgi:LysW-gamma-L-lysine carboxypeptidase